MKKKFLLCLLVMILITTGFTDVAKASEKQDFGVKADFIAELFEEYLDTNDKDYAIAEKGWAEGEPLLNVLLSNDVLILIMADSEDIANGIVVTNLISPDDIYEDQLRNVMLDIAFTITKADEKVRQKMITTLTEKKEMIAGSFYITSGMMDESNYYLLAPRGIIFESMLPSMGEITLYSFCRNEKAVQIILDSFFIL